MYLDKEKIKYLFPYFGTFILLISILKQTILFNEFNVAINNHIELSEFVSLTIPDLAKYLPICFIGILLLFLTDTEKENKWIHDNKKTAYSEPKFYKRLLQYYKIYSFVFNILFLLIPLNILIFFIKHSFFIESLYPTTVTLVGLVLNILLQEFRIKYRSSFNKDIGATTYNLILISIIVTLILGSKTYLQILNIKNSKQIITFFHENSLVKSSKELNFVGMTKNYIFLYDARKKESQVYDRDKISKIRIFDNNSK